MSFEKEEKISALDEPDHHRFERLGVGVVASFIEQGGLSEYLSRTDDLQYLTLGAHAALDEFDQSIEDEVEPERWGSLLKDDLPAAVPYLTRVFL